MAEYIDRNLIEWYGCNFEEPGCKNRECSGCSRAECSHTQVMQIPPADVIERSEYEKIKIERDISIQQIHDLGKSVSKAIEELQARADMFNKIGDSNNACTTRSALEILERNIGE